MFRDILDGLDSAVDRFGIATLVILLMAALTLLTLGSCHDQPAPGQSCPSPGTVYVHADSDGNLRLVCNRDGVWSE